MPFIHNHIHACIANNSVLINLKYAVSLHRVQSNKTDQSRYDFFLYDLIYLVSGFFMNLDNDKASVMCRPLPIR